MLLNSLPGKAASPPPSAKTAKPIHFYTMQCEILTELKKFKSNLDL